MTTLIPKAKRFPERKKSVFDSLSARKVHEERPFQPQETMSHARVAEKEGKGSPLEYILGRASFMGRMFYCTSDTLIPRPETSLLVTTAIDFIKKRENSGLGMQTLIEIGTGCGNIAVSLALMCERGVRILASDISPAAVEISRRNVHKFRAQEKIVLFCGDLFEPFGNYPEKVDMVICNPPYIPTTSLKRLSPEIIDHEPVVALDGGPYGFAFIRRLMNGALVVLKKDGILLFEIGEGQHKLIESFFAKKDTYKDIHFFNYKSKVRVISAVKK